MEITTYIAWISRNAFTSFTSIAISFSAGRAPIGTHWLGTYWYCKGKCNV